MKQTGEPALAHRQGDLAVDWYRLPLVDARDKLGSSLETGLSESEARGRIEIYGPNEVTERAGRTRFQIFFEQLTGVLTLILIGAAVISIVLDDTLDAGVILAIVVLNAVLGYTQEYRAERSMAALKRLSTPTVRVRRDSEVRELPSGEIVPGDVILLETGNLVPADGRVALGFNLRAQESMLTGESEAVEKEADIVFSSDRALAERLNMLYSGTVITYGHGEMLVTATGMATELGKIASLIQSVESEQTPLQKRLDGLGRALAIGAFALVVVVFFLGILRGENWEEMLLVSVSLAVAAVPEALTAVVTIALSLGAQRMLARKALIRKLPAVETLGSVNIICSDKTGTLTQNRMTITILDVANHRAEFVQDPDEPGLALIRVKGAAPQPELLPTLDLLLIAGALCNDSVLQREKERGSFRALGDPTEAALVLAAAQVGILKPDLDRAFPRVAELPFDSMRKRMTTIHRMPESADAIPPSLAEVWRRRAAIPQRPAYLGATKGAIDGMLHVCKQIWVDGQLQDLTPEWRIKIMESHDEIASKGMRVLGVGIHPFDTVPAKIDLEEAEEEVVLVGMMALIDPARPEVKEAVQLCKAAGIRPVMITGDHPLTARHIAHEIGISSNDRFLTGQELDDLSDEELDRETREVSVFARVSPEHKIRLIGAFQGQNNIVAMTGDGVNDAPALKKADIGVAMGITGTDVSKEAAEMVLLDDNFATIVAATREGRVIFDNIRRFIKYLLTCNASEIAVMLIGPFFGMPLPLLPLQILWMNLVTDGLPALALGVEPAEKNVMSRPPMKASESIFGHGMAPFIIVIGIVMSIVSIGVGLADFQAGDSHWQTLLFTTLIFCQLALSLELRSEDQSLFQINPFTNNALLGAVAGTILLQLAVIYVPFLQIIFKTESLPVELLVIPFFGAFIVTVAVEIWKAVLRKSRG